MGRLGNKTTAEEVKRLDSQNKIVRKLQNAVIKDTVTVPSGGFTIVRLYTNNPGKCWALYSTQCTLPSLFVYCYFKGQKFRILTEGVFVDRILVTTLPLGFSLVNRHGIGSSSWRR